MATSKRILVIDDDPAITHYLSSLLQRIGHRFDTCNNGSEGLAKAADTGYDMIISDLSMPGEPSEMDLIRQLREQRPDCPLVVVSGHPLEDRLNLCREIGVTEFLTKPFEISFIRNILDQVFAEADGKKVPQSDGGEA